VGWMLHTSNTPALVLEGPSGLGGGPGLRDPRALAVEHQDLRRPGRSQRVSKHVLCLFQAYRLEPLILKHYSNIAPVQVHW